MKKKGIQMPSGKSQDKAARSEKKTGQDKRGKGLRFRSRWSAMPEDRRVRIMKVAGLLVGVLAVFTFVSVTSYLFTWKADQSLLTETDLPERVGSPATAGDVASSLERTVSAIAAARGIPVSEVRHLVTNNSAALLAQSVHNPPAPSW